MQNSRILTQSILRVAVIDLLLTAAACFIPTASHLLALPLYMLNPMLALLLAGMLLGRDWRGALVLALLMPLVSSIVTGMPSTGKMFCMTVKLPLKQREPAYCHIFLLACYRLSIVLYDHYE